LDNFLVVLNVDGFGSQPVQVGYDPNDGTPLFGLDKVTRSADGDTIELWVYIPLGGENSYAPILRLDADTYELSESIIEDGLSSGYYDSYAPVVVPEPKEYFVLAALGLLGLAVYRKVGENI
jgi:hypothetical protein